MENSVEGPQKSNDINKLSHPGYILIGNQHTKEISVWPYLLWHYP
jgi:hypothetical protein